MQGEDDFLAKTLGKSLFHGQNDWSGHGPPASSDFWKAPLNENFHFGGQQCSVATFLALIASPDDDGIVSHDAPRFMLYYHCVRDTS